MALRFAPGRYEFVSPAGQSYVVDLTADQVQQIHGAAIRLRFVGTVTFRCLNVPGVREDPSAPPANATFADIIALAP